MIEKRIPKFCVGQIVVPGLVSHREQMKGQVIKVVTTETIDSTQIAYVCRIFETGRGVYGNPVVMEEMELVDWFDERFEKKEPETHE